jgi:hypothetical protein
MSDRSSWADAPGMDLPAGLDNLLGPTAAWCARRSHSYPWAEVGSMLQLPRGLDVAAWSPAAWVRASRPTTVPARLHRGQQTPTTGPSMPQLSADARDLNWLVANFATTTPGIAHAMVVSADVE